jgi:hypothetical protein
MSPRQIVASEVTKDTLLVGKSSFVQSHSPVGRFAAVFEDDGVTGYFYALDNSLQDNPIIDALHIYNVESVVNREKLSQLHIIWSADGLKTALFINSYPHAIYDFEKMRGCCRTGFPPVDKAKSEMTHEWDDSQMEHFHAAE